MNRRLITIAIITLVALVLLIVGGFMIRYYTSFKKVTVNIERSGVTAEILHIDTSVVESDEVNRITTLTQSGTLSLAPGKYAAVPKGENVDETQIVFTVADQDITVTVNPGYSADYLNSQLEKEFPLIKQALESKYGTTLADFTLNRGKLYEDGTWYATTLVKKSEGSDMSEVYRTVLYKDGDTWEVAAPPRLALSAPDFPEIPKAILEDVNQPPSQ